MRCVGLSRLLSGWKAILGRTSAVALAVVAFPAAAQAETFTVTTTADGINTNGSLAQAINLANDNAAFSNRIEFAITGTIQLANTLPTINKSIEILGPGAGSLTIRGAGSHRLLEVCNGNTLRSVTAAVSGLTLTNGFDGVEGGAILLEDASAPNVCRLSLNNAVVSGNSASATSGGGVATVQGGAISTENDTFLNIESSLISGNTASADGGAFAQAEGGGIALAPDSTATINNSTVSGNRATADSSGDAFAEGGGLMLGSDGADLTITNSTFSGNTVLADTGNCCEARAFGGAISTDAGAISNTTISGNRATANGGFPQAFGGFFGGFIGETVLTSVTLADNGTQIEVRTAASGTNNGGANLGGYAELKNALIADPVGGLNCGLPEPHGDPDPVSPVSNGSNYDEDGSCQFGAVTDVSGGDALLGPLADNGGATFTHALLDGSPAIDAGLNADAKTNDQRGVPRTVQVLEPTNEAAVTPPPATASKVNPNGGDGTDIGAYERQAVPGPDPIPDSGPNPDPTRKIHYSLRFKYVDKHGEAFVVARVFCHSVGCDLDGSGKIKILPFGGRKGIDKPEVFKIGDGEGSYPYVAGRKIAGKLRFKVSPSTATAVKKAIARGARGRVRAAINVTGQNQVQPDAVKKRFRNIKLFARSRVNNSNGN